MASPSPNQHAQQEVKQEPSSSSSSYWWFPPPINPGHALLAGSLPLLYSAYRDYHRSMAAIRNNVLINNNNKDAAVVRHRAGRVAGRALSIATRGCLGVYGLVCAGPVTLWWYANVTASSSSSSSSNSSSSSTTTSVRLRGQKDHDEPWGPFPDYDIMATRGLTQEEVEYLKRTFSLMRRQPEES